MKRWHTSFTCSPGSILDPDLETKRLLLETDGHTLIEAVVALALLVTVLVPVSGMLGLMAAGHRVERQMHALQLAERTLEKRLAQRNYQDVTRKIETHWRIEQETEHRDGLVEIRVAVYRQGREAPLVVLRTARALSEPPPVSPSWK